MVVLWLNELRMLWQEWCNSRAGRLAVKSVMPYFYRGGLGCSKVAQEGHALGGLRGWLRGLNKRSF